MKARGFLLSAASLLMVLAMPVRAERYSVTVKRIERNLYQDTTSKVIIETRYCLELALADDAILNWEGRFGDNWLLFIDSGAKCGVVTLR